MNLSHPSNNYHHVYGPRGAKKCFKEEAYQETPCSFVHVKSRVARQISRYKANASRLVVVNPALGCTNLLLPPFLVTWRSTNSSSVSGPLWSLRIELALLPLHRHIVVSLFSSLPQFSFYPPASFLTNGFWLWLITAPYLYPNGQMDQTCEPIVSRNPRNPHYAKDWYPQQQQPSLQFKVSNQN